MFGDSKVLDASAVERHFAEHIAPVWKALPNRRRGTFYTDTQEMAQYLGNRLGIQAQVGVPRFDSQGVLCASWNDLKRIHPRVPVIYMEHGVGLAYGISHPSYAGGPNRENVELFLCPNEESAELNRKSHPGKPIEVIGCPRLDLLPHRPPMRRVVAVTFHWMSTIRDAAGRLMPEGSWAYPEYKNYLRLLAKKSEADYVIGHSHPRVWDRLSAAYEKLGIEPVKEFTDVAERADILVADNTSVIWEFAALGRPVVVLNSVNYRKNVDLNRRFWRSLPGPQVDTGSDLAPTVKTVLDDPSPWDETRQEAVLDAYGPQDMKSTKRAVQAIKQHML